MRPLTIQIPQPCPERWDGMQPTEQGRFCANCQKTVVDYTALSDQELIRLLRQPSATTCGRFRDEQLNRPLVLSKQTVVSVWHRFIGLMSMSLFGWHVAQGQSVQMKQLLHQALERPIFSVEELPVRSTAGQGAESVVKGRVMLADSAGNLSPVSAYVSIRGAGDSWQAHTDSGGVFAVTIPGQMQTTKLSVWITTSDGLRGQATLNVAPSDKVITLDEITVRGVKIQPRADITGGHICVIQQPSRWQEFWRKLFYKG